MYKHLLQINKYYTHLDQLPDIAKFYWHYLWAHLFHLFHIDSSHIFFRARIIHTIQVCISFLSVFYLSKTLIRQLFNTIHTLQANYLAYWATLIWFTIFATISIGQHLIWIEWYSVTYQITLPLTLLLTGLTISLFFESLSFYKTILHITGIVLVSFIILTFHSPEYIYYLMYLFVLFILYLDKVIHFAKKHFIISLSIFIGLIIIFWNIHTIVHLISYRDPSMLNYLSFEKISLLGEKIMQDGHLVAIKFSRSFASFNELYFISLWLITITVIIMIVRFFLGKPALIRQRLLWFVAITSFFVFIPITDVTAGIVANLTYKGIVNRFYYSSLLFLAIPISLYYFLQLLHKDRIIFINLGIILILSSTYIYSKYDIGHHQNYYRNIQSLKNAFNERKVGFQLSSEQIKKIGTLLSNIKQMHANESLYFYTREDIGFVLRHIYHQAVYLPDHWNGRHFDINQYIKAYKKSDKKGKILLPVPQGFPDYTPYR